MSDNFKPISEIKATIGEPHPFPPTKPTVPEVLPLVQTVYARNEAGCCLHILLDDGNIKDNHAEFCLKYAREHGHADCIALAEKLVLMTQSQRWKLAKHKEKHLAGN
jgi:hypothetical protein